MSRYCSEITICLLLIIGTLAVYWQVRNHDFVDYDDRWKMAVAYEKVSQEKTALH